MGIQKGKKVFISSTAHDLVDLRAEVVADLTKLGFITLNHESPKFPVKQGLHPHDVCLEAVKQCDIFILIIDRRYGTPYLGNNEHYKSKNNWSITRCEADLAFSLNKGHSFVRTPVYYERKNYSDHIKKHGNTIDFVYSYVDKIEVLEFLDSIYKIPKWIDHFSDSVDLKRILAGRLIGDDDIFEVPYDGTKHDK